MPKATEQSSTPTPATPSQGASAGHCFTAVPPLGRKGLRA
jgi:hypothetical protein